MYRRYLEYHTLENPHWCLERLSAAHLRRHGALHDRRAPSDAAAASSARGACGVDFNFNHYSGNFWFATAAHVARLESPAAMVRRAGGADNANDLMGEVWIGRDTPARAHQCLGRSRFSLYRHALYRHLYAASGAPDGDAARDALFGFDVTADPWPPRPARRCAPPRALAELAERGLFEARAPRVARLRRRLARAYEAALYASSGAVLGPKELMRGGPRERERRGEVERVSSTARRRRG